MVMLGSSCSPCCTQTQCGCPPGQSLPDAVSVTFSGITKSITDKQSDLLALKFSSCFGALAFGTVEAPGGLPTEGFPITSISLTSGGSGYAKLGRVPPTLAVSGGQGSGATFTPTLSSTNDACGVPSWSIASVAATGGTGYVDGEQLTVSASKGDTQATAATVTVSTARTEPTLTASASPGSGAVLTVTLSVNAGSPPTWGVASVSVTGGGTGYTDGDTLTFSGGSGLKIDENAQAYITTGRAIPTLTASAIGSGTGASISPTLTQYTDWNGRPYWTVTAFTISSGGSGYSEFDEVAVSVTNGQASWWSYFYAYVSSVDENGAITGITIDGGGEFYKDTGVIESVDVWSGGAYHDDFGMPASVTVQNGGQYYREDANEPPYVAQVAVSISQKSPSAGTGAVLTATVDSVSTSPTFGTITSVSLDNKGSGYLGWAWKIADCNGARFNGNTFLLKRASASACHYTRCVGETDISVFYSGQSSAPTVVISPNGILGYSSSNCSITFSGDTPAACSPLSFAATDLLGQTAVVSPEADFAVVECGNFKSATLSVDTADYYTTMRIRYSFPGSVDPSTGELYVFEESYTFYWPGSLYAGTFQLTNGQYFHSGGGDACKSASLSATQVPFRNAFAINLFSLSFRYESKGLAGSTVFKEKSDFTCENVNSGSPWFRVNDGSGTIVCCSGGLNYLWGDFTPSTPPISFPSGSINRQVVTSPSAPSARRFSYVSG